MFRSFIQKYNYYAHIKDSGISCAITHILLQLQLAIYCVNTTQLPLLKQLILAQTPGDSTPHTPLHINSIHLSHNCQQQQQQLLTQFTCIVVFLDNYVMWWWAHFYRQYAATFPFQRYFRYITAAKMQYRKRGMEIANCAYI